jgi:hypothetical protein
MLIEPATRQLRLAALTLLALGGGLQAAVSPFEDVSDRPTDEVLLEATALFAEASGTARQALGLGRRGERLAEEAVDQLEQARDLLEDVTRRAGPAEREPALESLQELAWLLYWTRSLAVLAHEGSSRRRGDDLGARSAWHDAVALAKAHPDDVPPILLAFRGVAVQFSRTKIGDVAREYLLQLLGLGERTSELPEGLPPPPELDLGSDDDRRRPGPQLLISHLLEELDAEEPERRIAAAEQLALLNDQATVDPLVRSLIREKDREVVAAVLDALGHTPLAETLDCIDATLVSETSNNMLQTRVMDFLSEIDTPRASAVIAEMMMRDKRDDRVVTRGFEALGAMGREAAWGLSLLPGKLRKPDELDSITVLMGQTHDPRLAEYLLPFLDRGYMKRRYDEIRDPALMHPVQAMIALGYEAAPVLIDGLQQRKYQYWALYCLRQLSGKDWTEEEVERFQAWYEEECERVAKEREDAGQEQEQQ